MRYTLSVIRVTEAGESGLNILSMMLDESKAPGENPGFTAGHSDPSRHMALSPRIFFKKLRPSGSGFEYHDLTCELVCSHLAGELALPVPATTPVVSSTLGLGLVSAFVGQGTITGIPTDRIVNADKLPAMFVFEQLVMNVDDKTDHFRVRTLPGDSQYEFFVTDHGHTLHSWRNDLQDPIALDTNPALLQPSSTMNEYRVTHFSQLQAHLKSIATRATGCLSVVLDGCFDELTKLSKADAGLERFLGEASRHRAIFGKIIGTRASALESIVKRKCDQLGIPTSSEQSSSSLVGVQ